MDKYIIQKTKIHPQNLNIPCSSQEPVSIYIGNKAPVKDFNLNKSNKNIVSDIY